MSGFNIPPIRGLDSSFGLPQGPMRASEIFKSPEIQPIGNDRPDGGISVGDSKPFDGYLAESVKTVADLQSDTKQKVKAMVMGEDVELHDVMIAGQKSQVAFNLMLEVRNKLVDAWEKLSRSAG
ncbi:MAG: flagellar hook-basal body complex protein FliE [Hyphomicrobiaceae bacterium]|jgi:flagellar hook-basal body complex protein FliE